MMNPELVFMFFVDLYPEKKAEHQFMPQMVIWGISEILWCWEARLTMFKGRLVSFAMWYQLSNFPDK